MTNSIITADHSWRDTIAEIKKWGQPVEPQKTIGAKGRVSFEVINHTLIFDMRWPIVYSKPNTSWLYMAAEPMWVLMGSSKLSAFPEIARIQAPYSDNGVSTYGAYGPQYKRQKTYILDILNKDRNTRQAVMGIWRKNPSPMKDISCTVSLQWLIRDNTIYTIVNMRSSDAGLGLPYDMMTFACMTAEIAAQLTEPTELGVCYINAGSRHIYEDQWDKLDDVANHSELLYPAWQVWKWPAIRIVLENIANNPDVGIHRTEVQMEARNSILGASSGKTNS
jgi:thymidylate synthase